MDAAKKQLRQRMKPRLKKLAQEQITRHAAEREPLMKAKREMALAHRQKRQQLEKTLALRWERENEARLHRGRRGMWDWVSGRAKKVREQNRLEAWEALKRDQAEQDDLISRQLDDRREFQQHILELRERHSEERADLAADMGAALKLEGRKEAYRQQMRREQEQEQQRKRRGARFGAVALLVVSADQSS